MAQDQCKRMIAKLKEVIKNIIPRYFLDNIRSIRYKKQNSKFVDMCISDVFHKIYKENLWKNEESVPGPGSTIEATRSMIQKINEVFFKLQVVTILDAPCGDFHWMKTCELQNIDYVGADIVSSIIQKNTIKYGNKGIQFMVFDVVNDQMPKVDLIINRDCLVHFSYEDIYKTINNAIDSGSKYLMTTTFMSHKVNWDITTGDWRPINLMLAPFYFPYPHMVIEEYIPLDLKNRGEGKILGIWQISQLHKLK